jgi:antitoxin component of RelBE/YafQ-DinJ toxin-antitoxin module
MRRITFRADESLLESARRVARKEGKTLSEAFREWLRSYARPKHYVAEYEALMKELHYVNAGRKFTREEMNER